MPQNTILEDDVLTPQIFNERTFGWDGSFPGTWPANAWFIKTGASAGLYQNQGSEGTPSWVLIIDGIDVGLIIALGS